MKPLFALLLACLLPAAPAAAQSCTIDTVAGGGTMPGGEGGPALDAELLDPAFVVQAPDGQIYFADRGFFRIRRITPDGRIETVAGNGEIGTAGDGGPATEASLGSVQSLTFAPDGSLYWLELNRLVYSPLLRRRRPDGIIETVAGARNAGFDGDGGPAEAAGLFGAVDIAAGPDGSIYIASREVHRVRRIGPDGVIDTIAGSIDPRATQGFLAGDGGPAVDAILDRPDQVLVAPDSTIYIREANATRVRRVKPDGVIDTYLNTIPGPAGEDGSTRADAPYFRSSPIGLDGEGRLYWWSPAGVRRIGLDDRFETVWSGLRTSTLFSVTADGTPWSTDLGRLYQLVEGDQQRPAAGVDRTTYSGGDGGPAGESLLFPRDFVVTADGELFVHDNASQRIRTVRDGVIRNFAGNGANALPQDGAAATESALGGATAFTAGPPETVYFGERSYLVWRVGPDGIVARYAGVDSIMCERWRDNCGDGGPANQASLGLVNALAADSRGNLYIQHQQRGAFRNSQRTLRKVGPDGMITTITLPWDPDRTPTFHLFVGPRDRLFLYADGERDVRVLDESDTFVSFTRRGTVTGAWAIDSEGNAYERVAGLQRVSPEGTLTTIVPTSLDGSAGDGGPAYDAVLGSVSGLAVDADGNLYIHDYPARRIRRITRANECPAVDRPGIPFPTHAAGPTSLAPGTLFSIFGADIGPDDPIAVAPDASGRFPTEVAGTQVKMAGIAAPLIFLSKNQINGVVPAEAAAEERTIPSYDYSTRTSARMLLATVERSGVASAPVAMLLYSAAPALFSQGNNLAAALNQDGTLNGPTNPAAPGSIIVLFGSGEGRVSPPVPDGQIVAGAPLPRPVLPVSLTIGGEPAEILYAGAAPGLVSGVLQVNARISENQQALGAVRAVLKVGDFDNRGQFINVVVGR